MKWGYFGALSNKASCRIMTQFLFQGLQERFSSCRGRCSWADRVWKLAGFWAAALNRISCRQAYIRQLTKSFLTAVSRSHLSTEQAAQAIRTEGTFRTASADPHTVSHSPHLQSPWRRLNRWIQVKPSLVSNRWKQTVFIHDSHQRLSLETLDYTVFAVCGLHNTVTISSMFVPLFQLMYMFELYQYKKMFCGF